MIFLSGLKRAARAGVFLWVGIATISCESDVTTLGSGVIGGEPFVANKAVYNVSAINKKIEAVRSNKLPIYQLGTFVDPIYGRTEARITSQIRLSAFSPTFGAYSQTTEDGAENDDSSSTIPEEEAIDSVYLYIPFMQNPAGDKDGDGVFDEFDADPDDAASDTDGDGLTDAEETALGTNPLKKDTDGNGINDDQDPETPKNQFRRKIDVDSIYGDWTEGTRFNLKVERSTYYMRDLDPNANFQEAQAYYSSQRFAPDFVSDVLFDSIVTISKEEILLRKRDDESTEDVDESLEFTRVGPGIRVALNKEFFQQNFLDKEGDPELGSVAAFNDFIRGLHFSVSAVDSDIMMLVNMSQANITMSYSYQAIVDSEQKTRGKDYQINFLLRDSSSGAYTGNAVNTFANEDYPTGVADYFGTGENADRIFVKGGAGAYAEIKLFEEGDLEEIRAKKWVINEAHLIFYVDQSYFEGSDAPEPPRLYLYNLETGGVLFDANLDPTGDTSLSSYPEYDGLLKKESNGKGVSYTIRITSYLNRVISGDLENTTLGLTITPNIAFTGVAPAMLEGGEGKIAVASTLSPLGTVLYGNSGLDAADQDKKLQLEILYTEVE